tara:strand:+ start:576 stop:1634 length:1059 start_codon:yes stop_codon:yes gene_type:complete
LSIGHRFRIPLKNETIAQSQVRFEDEDEINHLPGLEKSIRQPDNKLPQKLTVDNCYVEKKISLRRNLRGDKEHVTRFVLRDDGPIDRIKKLYHATTKTLIHHKNMSPYILELNRYFAPLEASGGFDSHAKISHKEATQKIGEANAVLDTFRNTTSSSDFKKKIKAIQQSTERRERELKRWFNSFWYHHARLSWLHIQLGYQKVRYRDADQILADRKRLIEKFKNHPFSQNRVGYLSKIQYHHAKGLIIDFIMLLDTESDIDCDSQRENLVDLWHEIVDTNGSPGPKGAVWAEAASPRAFTINGIWDREDQNFHEHLMQMIRYLSYHDRFLRADLPHHARSLSKSGPASATSS